MVTLRSDFCSAPRLVAVASTSSLNRSCSVRWLASYSAALNWPGSPPSMRRLTKPEAAVKAVVARRKTAETICTADEIHHVSAPSSDWRLALWRYLPSPKAPPRNHPLLLLSGVGTNAVGYDLSPDSSFARFMSGHGYDTWILELRGAGLSALGEIDFAESKSDSSTSSVKGKTSGMLSNDEKPLSVTKLFENLMNLPKRLQSLINGGGENSGVSGVSDMRKQLDLISKYDWDFDHYLEEDVPAMMEYVRTRCKPRDGKLLAVGHSMGGILLYALLSKCCHEGKDAGLASITTLASTLDYTSSRSSLKLLLPLKEPAQTLNVPVPIGGLLAMAHPLASYPPYALSWLTPQISAPEMMSPELLEKLVLNNFCTVPAKLLLQLSTAFEDGGLCDRKGTFFYKEHIGKSNVPILALAGDQDLICPPDAVYETVKLIPEDFIAYRVFGEPGGPHYGHYDLVGGKMAINEVYPQIIEFLNRHDNI